MIFLSFSCFGQGTAIDLIHDSNGLGGQIVLYEENDDPFMFLSPDFTGTSGYFAILNGEDQVFAIDSLFTPTIIHFQKHSFFPST